MPPKRVLPVIVIAQFAGTSLWFAGNAILPELKAAFQLSEYAVSLVTSAVMLGFITGTLVFAIFALADRFSASRLFLFSSILGALTNSAVVWFVNDANSLFIARFLTGVFIAGIYPVGMKLASDWYDKGLGRAMGWLLGALVLGTAFPHLLKNRNFDFPWKIVLYATSLFAIAGGLLIYFFVGDGPHRRKVGSFKWNSIGLIFGSRNWRKAAFGYFGHMWELYAFWGFVPILLQLYVNKNGTPFDIPFWSFTTIGIGALGCIAGGYLSQKHGSAKVASLALFVSGCCCLLSPFSISFPPPIFLFFLMVWGFTVSPDSPQFSTLVAQYAPPHLRGTALTIYNSIGFTITIISMIIFDRLLHSATLLSGSNTFVVLALGALTGLPFIYSLARRTTNNSSDIPKS
jgi:MFS family permease